MKNQNLVVLKNHTQYTRASFLSFTNEYYSMLELLKTKIIKTKENESFPLLLGRVNDENFKCTAFTFDGITESYINHFVVKIKSDIEDAGSYQKQTIRFDNILGDIPVLPGYEHTKLIEFGSKLSEYVLFQNKVRIYMNSFINENLALYYQNDDMTISTIHTKLLQVNKSNFLGSDFQESFESSKTITHKSTSKDKYHRFISGNGFLFRVCPSWVSPYQQDDGYVFPTPKSELISLFD